MTKSTAMIADTFSFCPRCASRVEIGRVPLGSPLTCWSCGFEFVLARGTENRPESGRGRAEGHDTGSHVPEIIDRPSLSDEPGREERMCRVPPLRLFFVGTFRFPFYLTTLPQLTLLSVGGVALAATVRLALWCYYGDATATDKYTQVLLWNGLAFSFAVGSVFAMVWLCAAAACGLTIVRETSHGADAVEGWPNLLRLEGLGDVIYAANALMLSALPGMLATPLWRWLAVARPLGIAVTATLLLPIVLLSMLETRSPIGPVSMPVVQSVLYAWRAWLTFYVMATALIGATVALVMMAIQRGNSSVGSIAAGVLPTLSGVIYARLLGRLAYFCSGRAQQA
ncbi:MAG: hypothetical protein LLG00_00415 [Planctomycetaceae bacterium]|nr:hypothetical protein [Planctomycetaceae bacterium]